MQILCIIMRFLKNRGCKCTHCTHANDDPVHLRSDHTYSLIVAVCFRDHEKNFRLTKILLLLKTCPLRLDFQRIIPYLYLTCLPFCLQLLIQNFEWELESPRTCFLIGKKNFVFKYLPDNIQFHFEFFGYSFDEIFWPKLWALPTFPSELCNFVLNFQLHHRDNLCSQRCDYSQKVRTSSAVYYIKGVAKKITRTLMSSSTFWRILSYFQFIWQNADFVSFPMRYRMFLWDIWVQIYINFTAKVQFVKSSNL